MSLPIDRTYLLFFMPLFFLISGMFFKTYSSFRLFIVKKTNTLLVPFLFFYLTTALLLPNFLHYVLGMQMDGVKDWLGYKSLYAFIWPEYYYNNPIWFIWCLFIMSLMFYLLLKLSNKAKKHSIIVLLVLSFTIGLIGVVLGKKDINIGANIDTALSALPFFCVGYLLKNHTSILGENRRDRYNVVFMVLCFFVTWICSLYGSVNYKNNNFYMNPVLVYLSGVAGTLAILYLSKLLKSLPLISYWGRYSLIILVTHQLMIGAYRAICARLGLNGYFSLFITLIIMMLSYQLIIPVMKKVMPHVTAQKDLILLKVK